MMKAKSKENMEEKTMDEKTNTIIEIKHTTENISIEEYTTSIRYCDNQDFNKWIEYMEIIALNDFDIENFDDYLSTFLKNIVLPKHNEDMKYNLKIEDDEVLNYVPDLLDYATVEDMEVLADSLNLEVSTVGYSPWAYAIYSHGNRMEARDLYNGDGLYDLVIYNVLEDGSLEEVDYHYYVYLPTFKMVNDYINDIVDGNVAIIKNDITKYWEIELNYKTVEVYDVKKLK